MGGLAITVITLYCAPRGRRSGKGRGLEGGGLYPELVAYRISEGSSPNVQAEVGRLVGQLPIEQARAEKSTSVTGPTRRRAIARRSSWAPISWSCFTPITSMIPGLSRR